MSRYPYRPGTKGNTDTGQAGADYLAPKLGARQAEVLSAIREHGPIHADGIAALLERHINPVRPRVSELRCMGLIVDTGEREETEFGGKQAVFRMAMPDEQAAAAAARKEAA